MNSIIYLKEMNIKITKGRIHVLDILNVSEDAVSADYIFEKCRNSGVCLDLSTVYRTLELLEEKNLIEKFDLGDGKYNYMLKEKSHKHILHCSLCNKEIEIDCPMAQVGQLIRNKTGFTLTDHDLNIKGICEECNKSKK